MAMLAEEREWVDEWGATRKKVSGGVGAGVVGHPLDEWDKWMIIYCTIFQVFHQMKDLIRLCLL